MNEDEAKGLARDIEELRGFIQVARDEQDWIAWVLGSLVLLGWRLRLWAEGWKGSDDA
jgi:hypothetical protein